MEKGRLGLAPTVLSFGVLEKADTAMTSFFHLCGASTPKRRPVGSRRPSHFLFQIACNFNGSARLLPSLMRKCLGRSLALPIPPERFVGFKSETASLPEPNRTESGYRSDAIFVAANRGPAGINTSA